MAMIAKLCPPKYEKNYSFQAINASVAGWFTRKDLGLE